jgi:hypothetical protein
LYIKAILPLLKEPSLQLRRRKWCPTRHISFNNGVYTHRYIRRQKLFMDCQFALGMCPGNCTMTPDHDIIVNHLLSKESKHLWRSNARSRYWKVTHITTAPHCLTFYSHRYLLFYDCTFRTYINTCQKHIA